MLIKLKMERALKTARPRRFRRETRARMGHFEAGRRTGLRPAAPEIRGGAAEDVIRLIPLGGVEEIGKNMTLLEYRGSTVVVDMGLQFPDEETPGVDYLIPDTDYLERQKKKIKAVFITHGHLDHIGGIPYIMPKIGNPPIYTRVLTSMIIKRRQDEFPHLPKLHFELVEGSSRVRIADGFYARFFNVSHTIPDSMGIIFETQYGNVIFPGDIKIEHEAGRPGPAEEETFGKLGAENNLVLLGDSTNIERTGFSLPEKEVHKNLEELIKNAAGRIIIGTFASLLDRIMFIIEAAARLGKKVVIDGRSMKVNVEIAKELGLLKTDKKTFIPPEEIGAYPPNKIVILATGVQGDEAASLMRMANKTHRKIQVSKLDTIVLSSSIIPGNERAIQKLKDNLARQGAKIITYKELDIHSSGHGYREELKWLIEKIKPRFFIPIHGHHHFLRQHAELARETGISESNIVVPDNGTVIEIYEQGQKIRRLKGSVSNGVVMVDALGNGDVADVVIRDRQLLAQDGIFVVIATIDLASGKVKKSPDIISRGFIYLKESKELLHEARQITKKTIEETTAQMHPINFDYIKNLVREKLARFLLNKTGRRPIVLPVIIEI